MALSGLEIELALELLTFDEMASVSKLQKMMDTTPAEPTKNLNSNESLFKKGRTGSTFHIRHPQSLVLSRCVQDSLSDPAVHVSN